MTDASSRYLKELSAALAGTPRETRDEIIAGVREELEGLGEEDAAARIRELGDPAVIAAGARSEEPVEPRWRTVLVAILVGIGGFVVPLVGWGVGISVMTGSRAWTRRQKWTVALAPAAFAGVVAVFSIAVGTILGAVSQSADDGMSRTFANALSLPHVLVIVCALVMWATAFISGIWLFVKARR